jgi:hypothetical protein
VLKEWPVENDDATLPEEGRELGTGALEAAGTLDEGDEVEKLDNDVVMLNELDEIPEK